MRATIREVSEAAGVSIKTVSRVLNREKYVRDETRAKVEAAMEALDFRPSSAARALAGRRSFQVALLYDNPSPYYVYHLQAGALQRCVERGFRLLVQPCDIYSPSLARDIGALIDETHLDGLILSPPVSDVEGLLAELDRRGTPYVRIAPGADPGGTPSVAMDDVAAARSMTEHLLALGHRRIGFVRGHPDHAASHRRYDGYCAALGGAGIALDETLVREGQFDHESGRIAARALLGHASPPTAIFASNDDMAAGVLSVAHEMGVALPEKLSVAGFDDSDLARLVWPPLTTVRQPTRDLAYMAAGLLIDGESDHVALDHAIVTRGSTSPPG